MRRPSLSASPQAPPEQSPALPRHTRSPCCCSALLGGETKADLFEKAQLLVLTTYNLDKMETGAPG